MSEKERQILETFSRLIPRLSDLEKEKLLAFGEGLGFAIDHGNEEAAHERIVNL